MEKIVLYTKSYRNDLIRVERLLESIKKHNRDNIKYYISVPAEDFSLFMDSLDMTNTAYLMKDELIYETDIKTKYINQQIIKSSFWKLGLCENYVMVDSDSLFIKDFYISDFMYNDTTPYTVMHEQKELFEWTDRYNYMLGFDPKIAFENERRQIMDIFNRVGKIYDFGPSPTIWSAKVWKSFEEKYLIPNKLTFEDIIKICASEFTWYGEWLLKDKTIEIYPAEALFKVFHYKIQYDFYKKLKYTEENFKQTYLGMVLQSNWNAPLQY